MRRRIRSVATLLIVCGGCGQQTSGGRSSTTAPPPDGGTVQPPTIDTYKELVIVDSSVVLDSRGSNRTNGAWSFRNTMERLTPAGMTAPALVESWLKSFRAAAHSRS